MGTSPGATLGFKVLTGHPEKQIDYATRSINLMTVRAKQIIQAFYGDSPKYSYFVGCSGGGGSAMHEVLQFPGDYDGIIAGAPFMNVTHGARTTSGTFRPSMARPRSRWTRRSRLLPRWSSNAPARMAVCDRTIF